MKRLACDFHGAPTVPQLMPVTEATLWWAQIEMLRDELVTARQARSLHVPARASSCRS